MTARHLSHFAFFLTLVAALAAPSVVGASGQAENARALIDSGHAGAVRWMESDDTRGLLFTSGEDGTVRIWDPAAGILLRTLQVTQLLTGRIAVSPASARLAVVVTDGGGQSSLAVWDWEKERQLYRVPLKEEPAFLRFSPLGTYVLYGESSWQGLKIIQADTGSPFPFHPDGFGIVGFAEMSRTEKVLMTYQISGTIAYWDVSTGAQTQAVSTVPYLSGIRMSRDRGVLVGSTQTEIVRVDAVSGVVKGRQPASGIVSLDISGAGDEISVIPEPGQPPSRWRVSADMLAAGATFPPLHGQPSRLAYCGDSLCVADASGLLQAISPGGEVKEFGSNAVARITGLDAAPGLLALASADWVRVLAIEGLDENAPPTAVHTLPAPNPFSDDAGLAFVDTGRLLAWRKGGGAPGLAVLGIATISGQPGAFVPVSSPFKAPLTDLRVSPEEMIGVESGGTLRVADPRTGATRRESRVAGANAAVRVSDKELVVARNTSGSSPGSLVRVNLSTGETVAIRDRNHFTYSLLLDAGAADGPALYSVGVDASRATNLIRHDGPGFDRETVLDSVPYEYLDADLSLDPDGHTLFATMGTDRAVSWDGKTLKTLSLRNTMPIRLVVRAGLVFSRNKDSTVTVVDGATGASRAEIALFQDGEWCMVFADGRYVASTGGDPRVRVFSGNAPVAATEDYRLRIDAR